MWPWFWQKEENNVRCFLLFKKDKTKLEIIKTNDVCLVLNENDESTSVTSVFFSFIDFIINKKITEKINGMQELTFDRS